MATKTKQPKEIKDLQAPLKELHRIFDTANKVLFNNELPSVVITIQSKGKTNSLGWFTVNPLWVAGEANELHEINISAEALKRDFMEIVTTMVHEMLHLFASVNGIKDVSRGNTYHNKKFKQIAEQHGMEYKHEAPDKKIGYSDVSLTEETIKKVKFWNIQKEAFSIARKDFGAGAGKEKKKTNIIKWICPACGDIIRSSKPSIKAFCMNDAEGTKEPCAVMFERETPEEDAGE